ncbi:MAG: AAA family ATPase, partial [Clostridia bacterium]|nr:AAA family ATPase [Clostridia bacterium]
QFTPDLLPADITGMRIFQPDTHSFSFIPGPVFSNILLADEINRATPRTQSALLECMEETQVTDGGETRILVPPFFVIATQNPVETQGTFMLPEAQLDRFMMKLSMAVPTLDQTAEIMERIQLQHPIESLHAVTDKEALLQAIGEVKKVYLSHELFLYIASLCKAAQNPELVKLGPSPRAAIAVMRTSQAYAYLHGRNYVIPDDVKAVFLPVIHHRMILRGSSSEERISAFLTECMDKVPVPTEDRL